MSNETPKTRIRIARGSKEKLEQVRGSLLSGELFWQKADPQDPDSGELLVGNEDESNGDPSTNDQ